MMSLNDFVNKNKLKNEATSNIKIQQVLSSLSLNDVGKYLRHGPISSTIGIANLDPTKGKHRVAYINEKHFDSYGCSPPNKLSLFSKKRKGYCL